MYDQALPYCLAFFTALTAIKKRPDREYSYNAVDDEWGNDQELFGAQGEDQIDTYRGLKQKPNAPDRCHHAHRG